MKIKVEVFYDRRVINHVLTLIPENEEEKNIIIKLNLSLSMQEGLIKGIKPIYMDPEVKFLIKEKES